MTGQIHDIFLYNDEEYEITGITGGKLFSPENFGLKPFSTITACWRGYQIFYALIENNLVIDTMLINLEQEEAINKITPVVLGKPDYKKEGYEADSYYFKYYYPNLNLPLKFTGKVLIAKDIKRGMYEHMGFQKPESYKTLIELSFEEGKLVKELDKSVKKQNRRKNLFKKEALHVTIENENLQEQSDDSFSLDYTVEEN